MLEVALLIFAIAFAVMVGVFIPIGVKLYKTVDVVNETIEESKETINRFLAGQVITYLETLINVPAEKT